MNMILVFLATIISCFILDMLWLGLIARNLYDNAIGDLIRKSGGNMTPNWPAAGLVYVFIALGIILFVLPKANQQTTSALFWGAIFGMVLYGVYDFTNFAVLKVWPLNITIIDFIWGTFLCSMCSLVAVNVQKFFA